MGSSQLSRCAVNAIQVRSEKSMKYAIFLLLMGAAVCVPVAAQQSDKDTPPPAPGQLVDIGGCRLHLLCSGKGSPTVVAENGASGFSIDWALVQPEVAK